MYQCICGGGIFHRRGSGCIAIPALSAVGFRSSRGDEEGVFLVKMKNAFVPVKRDNSVNTYSRILNVPRGSERSE